VPQRFFAAALYLCAFCFASNRSSLAQALPAGASTANTTSTASTNGEGPAGIVPFTKGFNASLGVSGQHDSAAGWSSTLNPNVAWRFDKHLSVNISIPLFDYVVTSKTPKGAIVPVLRVQHHALGDMIAEGDFEAHSELFDYTLSLSASAPTGDSNDGLGAGKFTGGFNNHFEHPLTDWLTPDLELGLGDNPGLNNARVRRSYADVGLAAYFQFGFEISLPLNADFETDAYENLPLGSQTITSSTVHGKKGQQTTATSTPASAGEDNGFLNTLDVPLTPHFKLSGFYNRSLRERDDTVGFSITYLLRAPPRPK